MTVRNILILMALFVIAVPSFAQGSSTPGSPFILPGAWPPMRGSIHGGPPRPTTQDTSDHRGN